MQQIQATLPTLGSVVINFYRETDQVLEFFGDGELDRLGRVPHLGVASSVFTGVQHSRQEYTLLQCAIVELVARLHSHAEQLALANKVSIDGTSEKVSSGEELLKSWFLLSNFGHAKQTFGTERGLLSQARQNPNVADWIFEATPETDLKKWAQQVIREFRYEDVHYLLVLLRLRYNNPHDPRKHLFRQLVRNLVLPEGELLETADSEDHYKLRRLRTLHSRIRALAIVTIDAHYSHSPFDVQLQSAINSLARFLTGAGGAERFNRFVREMGAQLADELYLHPNSCAVARAYDRKVSKRFPARFKSANKNDRLDRFLTQIMADGFGQAEPGNLHPLFRFSTGRGGHILDIGDDRLASRKQLEKRVASPPETQVSVDMNPFSKEVYLDFFFQPESATPPAIASVQKKIRSWLERLIRERAENQRPSFPPSLTEEIRTEISRVIRRFEEQEIRRAQPVFDELFYGTMRFLLPNGWSVYIREYDRETHEEPSVRYRLRTRAGRAYDTVTEEIGRVIATQSYFGNDDRVQELRALERVLQHRQADLVLAVYDPLIITDQFDHDRDQWDGAILEIDDDRVRLTIIEAKNYGSRERTENRAFKQLRDSIEIICSEHRIKYRRRRIAGLGAQAVFYLDEEKGENV